LSRPRSLLVARLGQAQAEQLSTIAGGVQIWIPDNLTTSAHNAGTLRARVGDALFALLVFHFGGTRIYIPQAGDGSKSSNRKLDNSRINRLTKQGWSASRIARHFGCSDRTIYARRALLRSRTGTNGRKNGE